MNYLAHIYLSGSSTRMQVGGFIADAVKGKYDNYPKTIQKGIALHREIDNFTDSHETVKECIARLRPHFGKYSTILPDLFFDHYLASDFTDLTGKSLDSFSYRFYISLILNYKHLPLRVQNFVWHFIITNRLGRYRTLKGLNESLEIMRRYNRLPLDTDEIMIHFRENYNFYRSAFDAFFPEIIYFAADHRHAK